MNYSGDKKRYNLISNNTDYTLHIIISYIYNINNVKHIKKHYNAIYNPLAQRLRSLSI